MSYDTDVREALAAHYDEFAVECEIHEMPPHVTFEVTVAGRRAVCKLTRGPEADPATEGRILQHVGRATDVPVPEVLAVGADYFVAEWCGDVPQGETRAADEAWARAAGEATATLHEQAGFDRPGFPVAADGDAPVDDGAPDGAVALAVDARESWHATACDYLAALRDWLEPYGYGHVPAELRGFLRTHPGCLEGAGDPVLCHGNVAPEHVGVRDGEAACVVDFEHALVAPGEYDYWRTVVAGLPGSPDPDGDAAVAFRAGYESVRALPPGLERRGPLYRALVAAWALQSLFCQRNVTGEEAGERADRLREHVAETLADLRAARD